MDSFTPESFALGIEIIVCLGLLYGTFYVGQPQHSVKVSVLVVVLWFLLSGSENALAQTTQVLGQQPMLLLRFPRSLKTV
jgi:hypothetical protein